MAKITAKMALNSAKKHSVRYDAADPESGKVLTSVYVGKEHLPSPAPTTLTVTVEWA